MITLPTVRNTEDLRTITLVSMYFAMVYVAWKYETLLGLWVYPLVVLICGFSFVGATATHNTMHCKVFKERWANKTWQLMLTLTYGHPVSTYVPGHNLSHHKYTQLKKDIMRTSKLRWKWNFLNFVLFQPTVAGDVLKSDLKFLRLQYLLGRPFFVQVMRELLWLVVVMVSLCVLDWRKFLVYFHLPHLFGQWGIVTMNLLQHDGCDIVPEGVTGNYNHSRNFTGWLLNFLTMNNGYHTIHHMFPTMHWSEYPAAHERLIKPHMHPELSQSSMAKYIWTATIYPGNRVMYNGEPVDISNGVGGDDDWLQYPKGVEAADVSITGSRVLDMFARGAVLAVGKLICPMWSPFVKLA